MSSGAVTVLVVVIVVLVIAALLVMRQQAQRRRLRGRFGPEYERAVADHENRREAEQELAARERRHADLDIRALPPDVRDRYSEQWLLVQEKFVDSPGAAVGEADRLVTALMSDRGYPTEGFDQQVADLSVQHAGTLDHYRAAHEISGRAADNSATTEDLRQAMVHYRALFEELLENRVNVDRRPPT